MKNVLTAVHANLPVPILPFILMANLMKWTVKNLMPLALIFITLYRKNAQSALAFMMSRSAKLYVPLIALFQIRIIQENKTQTSLTALRETCFRKLAVPGVL